MKTLIASAEEAPDANDLPVPSIRSAETRVPGASAARSRKLRLAVGSASICFWLTEVPTSELCSGAAAVTASSSSFTASAASVTSRRVASAMRSVATRSAGAKPMPTILMSYWPGRRPGTL